MAAALAAATLLVERPLEVRVEAADEAPGGAGQTAWDGPTASRARSVVPTYRRAVRIGGLSPGTRIEVRYQHTVERTPIVEVFRVERDGLWFEEVRFASQGAGLPSDGYVREGDHYVLRQPRRIGALALRVSARAGHRLRVGGEEVALAATFGDGASVVMTAGPGGWRLRWRRFRGESGASA
ncbi:MAG: DUF1850 domain-containing protein [Armatimonadota bacterium]|nr:DUF1850 domain-containing protein [Armatimonadota bacterium]